LIGYVDKDTRTAQQAIVQWHPRLKISQRRSSQEQSLCDSDESLSDIPRRATRDRFLPQGRAFAETDDTQLGHPRYAGARRCATINQVRRQWRSHAERADADGSHF
jgi:hypothetical protein